MAIPIDINQNNLLLGILSTFCGWLGIQTFVRNGCAKKLEQELRDLKDDFKDFMKEYRDKHS